MPQLERFFQQQGLFTVYTHFILMQAGPVENFFKATLNDSCVLIC